MTTIRATFNPGPSQLADGVSADLRAIGESGVLALSHRGVEVRKVVVDAIAAVREALRVPDEYAVVFQPSATAAMEFVLRNFVQARAAHFVGGAFAKRFADTTDAIGLEAHRIEWEWSSAPDIWSPIPGGAELVAVTHNETSTGAMWPDDQLATLRARLGESLLAVDVTSSLGGVPVNFLLADVWFASVQKCLGLPAGLALVVVGPRAMERAAALGDARSSAPWQDALELAKRAATGQTYETPNVLGLALLGRRMARYDAAAAQARVAELGQRIAAAGLPCRHFVEDPAWRSRTVHNLVVDDPDGWVARAAAAGFVLGRGYGEQRANCVRIATFPQHRVADLDALLEVLAG